MDTTEMHKRLLDDVPQSMKRYKVGAEKLATVVMFVKDGVQDSWLDADNLRGLGSLIGFHVTGARVHRETRARLFEHDRHRQLRRLTLMCTAADVIDIRDDGPGRTRTRQKHPAWTGMTIFYEQRPKYGIRDEIKYIDTPMGLIQMLLSKEEADDVADIFSTWNFPASVYALQMKPSGKELDPKMFDKQEKRAFNEADAAEWKSWLANGSVRVVPLGKESSIPRDQVFSAPMRFVRTNKSKDPEKLQAKSRLIIPGHRDPQLGLYRTDSPTTSGLAVMVVATIAAARGWFMKFFDVSTAFLSGKEIGRTVFIRAPPEGLPSVHGQRAVQPYQLLQVLKGAYGLTEAPRLWYLRARELLLEIGFVELCCARAVFILREQEETIAMLTLHVDDGLLAGDRSHKKYQKVYKAINERFNIREWHDLMTGTADYLGMQWSQDAHGVQVNMDVYIQGINELDVKASKPAGGDPPGLENEDVHMFRSVLAKVRWPVSHVIPELAYSVSALAQVRPQDLSEDHVKQLNGVVQALRKLSETGKAKVILPKINIEQITVMTALDASFAKEPGMKSQAGFMSFLTDWSVMQVEAPCALVEFQSVTISRVVKSTLAAESMSLSTALDRQLYLRLLVQSLLHGEPVYDPEWRHKLKVPGVLITDAKSLYDHLNTTGKVPKERQTLIDLLVARDLIETGAVKLMWVPTAHMVADILTKVMKPTSCYVRLRDTQRFSVARTEDDEEREQRRLELRQGQRQRRKERNGTRSVPKGP
jgi:hypothetical protein